MNPAQYVVTQFGSLRETGSAIGRHWTSVHRWLASKNDGGTGGLIPSENHRKILAEAKKRGLDITPDHLIFGDKIHSLPSKRTEK